MPVRLNTNENPYPPSAALVADIAAAVGEVAGGLNRYPDRDAVALRTALAGYLGHGLTGRASAWAANGSNEIIQQLLQAFGGPGRSALGFEPSYSMHPLIARRPRRGGSPRSGRATSASIPASRVGAVRRHQPDVVFLTSPNNPTGAATPLAVIEAVCAAAARRHGGRSTRPTPSSPGTPAVPPWPCCRGYPRLVVVRTMSKAFALAGARVGYLAADPAVVGRAAAGAAALSPVRGDPGGRAGRAAALRRAAGLGRRHPRRARRGSCGGLRGAGLDGRDSDANFVLFGRFADRHAIWQALLDRGVLIRETGPPDGCA